MDIIITRWSVIGITLCGLLAASGIANPIITQHPQPGHVTKNDTLVTLNCTAQGDPSPQITWYKDGLQLSDAVVLPTGQIQLRNSVVSNSRGQRSSVTGEYYCNATNPLTGVSALSRTARIQLAEKPSVTQGPKDTSVVENSDVLFYCSATGIPKPVIVWKKLDGQIPAERSEIRSDNSLKIRSVTSSDEGQYVCRVENTFGSTQVNAKLNVYTQPTFLVEPTDKLASVGQRLHVRCVATGNPAPTVYWKKLSAQTLLFPNEHTERIHVSEDGTLNIDSVQADDAAEYSCQALNTAGSSFVNIRISISESELRPPPIIYQGSQNQTLPVDSVATLPCLASGEPAPVTYWFKGASVVTGNSRVTTLKSGTLEIRDLMVSDSGIYTCLAVSEMGETRWISNLVVEQSSSSVVFHRTPDSSTFPGAPSKPLVYNVTDTALALSWKPNDINGASAVLSYSVEYFSQKVCQCWSVLSEGVSQPFYTVHNLLPNTSYVFLVRAHNSHGTSLPSAVTTTIRTKAAPAPVSVPRLDIVLSSINIHLESPDFVNSSAVKLSWKISHQSRVYRHLLEGYYVMYRRVYSAARQDDDVVQYAEVDYSVLTVRSPMETSCVLTGLLESSSYEIFVQPFNGLTLGTTSNMIRVLMVDRVDVMDMTSPWTGQPWFIATLVSLIGGAFLVALCVCTVCLIRQRNRFKKQTINNSVSTIGAKHANNCNTLPVNRTRYDVRCLDPLLTVDGGGVYSVVANGNKKSTNSRRGHGNKSQVVSCCYDNSSATSNELRQQHLKVHQPVSVLSNDVRLPPLRTHPSNVDAVSHHVTQSSTPPLQTIPPYGGGSIPNPEAYMIQRMSHENRAQTDDVIDDMHAYEQWQNYDWL